MQCPCTPKTLGADHPLPLGVVHERHPIRAELGHWKGYMAMHSLTRRVGQNVSQGSLPLVWVAHGGKEVTKQHNS